MIMDFGQKIAARIREIRKSKNLTQEKLSEKANMDLTAFSRIERGKNSNIQLNTLDKIIQSLEIDYPTFFTFSDSEQAHDRILAKLSLLENDTEAMETIEKVIDLAIRKNSK